MSMKRFFNVFVLLNILFLSINLEGLATNDTTETVDFKTIGRNRIRKLTKEQLLAIIKTYKPQSRNKKYYGKWASVYERLIQINPENSNHKTHLYNLAVYYHLLQNYPRSLTFYKKTLILDENHINSLKGFIGILEIQYKKSSQGKKNIIKEDLNASLSKLIVLLMHPNNLEKFKLKEVEQYIQKQQAYCTNLTNFGVYYSKLSSLTKDIQYFKKARECFKEALEKNKENYIAKSNLAKIYAAQHQFDKAESLFKEVMSVSQYHIIAFENLLCLYLFAGKNENTQILKWLLKASNLLKDNKKEKNKFPHQTMEIYRRLTLYYRNIDNYKQALKYLKKSYHFLTRENSTPYDKNKEKDLVNEIALTYQEAFFNPKNTDTLEEKIILLEKSARLLSDLIKQYPNNVLFLVSYGQLNHLLGAYYEKGSTLEKDYFKKYFSASRKAVLLAPNNIGALNNYASSLTESGKLQEAEKLLNKAKKLALDKDLNKTLIHIYYNLSHIYLIKEELKQSKIYILNSLECYEKIKDPSFRLKRFKENSKLLLKDILLKEEESHLY